MKKDRFLRILLPVLGGIATIALTMAALLPFLENILAVEIKTTEKTVALTTPAPAKAEETLVTAVYILEEGSREIEEIYVEVFRTETGVLNRMEIPTDTKVTLSEELYKSLQAYSPELPQYLKLQKMAEGFSKEYAFTGCNRILSEVLGVTVSHYVCADKELFEVWNEVMQTEHMPSGFFDAYRQWVAGTESDSTETERWIYYESLYRVLEIKTETAAGTQEKDGFAISQKQVRNRLEMMIRGIEETK